MVILPILKILGDDNSHLSYSYFLLKRLVNLLDFFDLSNIGWFPLREGGAVPSHVASTSIALGSLAGVEEVIEKGR